MSFFRRHWNRLTDRGVFALGLLVGALAVVSSFVFVSALAGDPEAYIQNGAGGSEAQDYGQTTKVPMIVEWARKLFKFEDTIAQWVVMLFTIAAFWMLIRTFRVTREIGKAQTRAYLTRLRGGLWEGYGLEMALEIKNSGNSPAFDVYIMFEMEYFVESSNSPQKRIIGGGEGPPLVIDVYPKEVRHFYTHAYPLGDIGAGDVVSLKSSSFVGFHSAHHDSSREVTNANVGIFARDIFSEEITFFGGVGFFDSQDDYQRSKDIFAKSSPHRTRGCTSRMKAQWDSHKMHNRDA